jgi:hypothetical protein
VQQIELVRILAFHKVKDAIELQYGTLFLKFEHTGNFISGIAYECIRAYPLKISRLVV